MQNRMALGLYGKQRVENVIHVAKQIWLIKAKIEGVEIGLERASYKSVKARYQRDAVYPKLLQSKAIVHNSVLSTGWNKRYDNPRFRKLV